MKCYNSPPNLVGVVGEGVDGAARAEVPQAHSAVAGAVRD